MITLHKRTMAKSITWRIISVSVTTIIAYLFTKDVTLSLSISMIDLLIKIGLFYGHERLWKRTGLFKK